MQINKTKQDDVVVCDVNGDIDINSSLEMRKTFSQIIDDKAQKILINLRDVSYIDSSGLATLVEILKKSKSYGGELRLSNLTDKVKGIFEITKLVKIFKIYDNTEEALSNFGN